MKIGILTSGGDCPGLNAVIRGIVLKGTTTYDLEFVGIRDGWRGVVDGDFFPLTRHEVTVSYTHLTLPTIYSV